MKKAFYISACLFLLQYILAGTAFSQKKISELTVAYNYTLNTGVGGIDGKQPGQTTYSALSTVYIKANLSRTDISNSMFSSSTIYDVNTGSGVLLRELNGQKLLIRINPDNWEDKNRRYQGLRFTSVTETKIIAGYKCEKATATTKDGFIITVFYTRDLVPENKGYDAMFKNLDGLPLEYELTKGSTQIKYVLASINLNPVPASKFDIPKSGYREMTYEESKKLSAEK